VFDVEKIRSDFPILSREVNGKPLVYLDSGASAQKPQVVIDAVTQAYSMEYANVHRGLHYLSNLATDKYEAVRGTIAKFLNAQSEDEIVLNSGTTEGINTVAYGWAMPRMQAGDEIVLSVMEHHANIVPWAPRWMSKRSPKPPMKRVCRCWSMARRGRCICRWMCRIWIVISTRSRGINSMGHQGPVRSISNPNEWRKCSPLLAVAT